MKEKISKLLAGLLAVVLVLTGMTVVPNVIASAAGNPSITLKIDKSEAKPGDVISAELWIDAGSDVSQVIGPVNFDTQTYTFVKGSVKSNLELQDMVINECGGMWMVDQADVYTKGGFSVLIDALGESLNKGEAVRLFSFKVTVNESPAGTGTLGFECKGVQSNGEDVPLENVVTSTVDKTTGTVITDSKLPVKIELKSLTMSKPSLTLAKGASEQLTVTADPEAAIAGQTIVWKSSNNNVATVAEDGTVTATGKGSAVITASVAGKDVTCDVTVNVPLTGVAMNKETLTLKKGQTETLVATPVPADADGVTAAEWTSSEPSVASVGADGTVTALKDGQTTITAKIGDKTASCVVTVQEKKLESISLNKTAATIARGSELALTVTYTPDDTTDAKEVTWESSAPDVASVDANGLVKALKAGEATITATTKDGAHSAECKVEVNVPLVSITPSQDVLGVGKGATKNVTFKLNPEDTTDDKAVDVKVDVADSVADVAYNVSDDLTEITVTVTGKTDGTGTVTVTSKNNPEIKAVCTIKVTEIHMTGIELTNLPAALEVGDTATLGVKVLPADTTDDQAVTWTSSNESVAKVDENGKVTAIAGGVTTITATAVVNNTIKDSYELKVLTHIESIALNETSVVLNKGENKTLTYVIAPAENDDDKTVTWTTDNDKVATVADGVVTAVDAGTATITATTSNGKTAECVVTVKAPIESISLNKENTTLEAGQSETLVVTYSPENTTDEKAVTWKSDKESVATVDGNGVVTAVAPGTAVITATTANGKTATCEVKVPLHIESLELPSDLQTEYKVGQTFKMPVIVNPVGAEDVVVYSTSDSKVATVDAEGNVTILEAGEVVLTAVVQGNETIKAEYTIKAEHIPVEGIAFDKVVEKLEAGQTAQIGIIYNPENATSGKAVTWSSSDEAVATVKDGLVQALKEGKTTIKAVAENGTEISFELTVTAKKVPADQGAANQGTTNKKDPAVNKGDKAPNTGDASGFIGVAAAMLLSISVIVLAVYSRLRKRNYR